MLDASFQIFLNNIPKNIYFHFKTHNHLISQGLLKNFIQINAFYIFLSIFLLKLNPIHREKKKYKINIWIYHNFWLGLQFCIYSFVPRIFLKLKFVMNVKVIPYSNIALRRQNQLYCYKILSYVDIPRFLILLVLFQCWKIRSLKMYFFILLGYWLNK